MDTVDGVLLKATDRCMPTKEEARFGFTAVRSFSHDQIPLNKSPKVICLHFCNRMVSARQITSTCATTGWGDRDSSTHRA